MHSNNDTFEDNLPPQDIIRFLYRAKCTLVIQFPDRAIASNYYLIRN